MLHVLCADEFITKKRKKEEKRKREESERDFAIVTKCQNEMLYKGKKQPAKQLRLYKNGTLNKTRQNKMKQNSRKKWQEQRRGKALRVYVVRAVSTPMQKNRSE